SKNVVLKLLQGLKEQTSSLEIDSKKAYEDEVYREEMRAEILKDFELKEIVDQEFIDYNKNRLKFFRDLNIGQAISDRLAGKLADLIIYGVVNSEASEMFVRMILMEEVENEIFKYLEEKESSVIISDKALRYDLTVPFARYVVQHQ